MDFYYCSRLWNMLVKKIGLYKKAEAEEVDDVESAIAKSWDSNKCMGN